MPSLSLAQQTAYRRQRKYGRRFILPSGGVPPSSVTFPQAHLVTRAWIALTPSPSLPWWQWGWTDVTAYVRKDLGISIDEGRRNESTRVNTTRCTLKLDNRDGRFVRLNPLGPYFGHLTRNTPIWIELNPGDGFRDMFQGYVNAWPTAWTDPSGNNSYVTISCAGVMRRLAQGQNLKSAMYRSMAGVAASDYVPHAFWSMEDGANATQLASGLSGGAPLVVSGAFTPADNSELTGSEPLPTFPVGTIIHAAVPSYTATGKWVVQFVFRVPEEPAAEITILEAQSTGGTAALYRLTLDPSSDSLSIASYTSGGVLITSALAVLDPDTFYGRWHTFALAVRPYSVTPTDTIFTLHIFDGLGFSDGPYGNLVSSSGPGVVTQVRLFANVEMNYGHLGVFIDANFNTTTDVAATAPAMYGHSGEQAHLRKARLCREEGVPFFCVAASSAPMGPQPRGTLLEALREAEAADQGVLYEYQFGLAYQALSERYDAPVALELDFAQRHIYGTPEAADDDQRLRNEWTIRRRNGSSGTYRNDVSVAAEGLYDDGDTVNLYEDGQLVPHASHRVWIGTVDEVRWPRVALNLGGTPELIAAWLATRLNNRITIANPPAEMPPDAIDVVLEGRSQRWDQVTWTASMNLSPARPYQVGGAGDSTGGSWASPSDAVLAEDLDTTETSIEVTSTDTWTTTPAGELIAFGGEVVSLDAVSGSAPNWTFDVTRAVNGVVKTHSAGASVQLHRPLVAVY